MLNKNIKISILILILYCITCNFIFEKQTNISNIATTQNKVLISKQKTIDKDVIATISIPKINLKKNIYQENSPQNNVNKNVTLLSGSILPDHNDSIIFLAAHSGSGNNAYFNNLKNLSINEKVTLFYNNEEYTYKIVKIREVPKNGYITGNRNSNKELILTTCSDKKNKQLIIDSILEKEDD